MFDFKVYGIYSYSLSTLLCSSLWPKTWVEYWMYRILERPGSAGKMFWYKYRVKEKVYALTNSVIDNEKTRLESILICQNVKNIWRLSKIPLVVKVSMIMKAFIMFHYSFFSLPTVQQQCFGKPLAWSCNSINCLTVVKQT